MDCPEGSGHLTRHRAPGDLAYCHTDGPAGTLPVPDHPLFRALLDSDEVDVDISGFRQDP
jgi:hypothetical protein